MEMGDGWDRKGADKGEVCTSVGKSKFVNRVVSVEDLGSAVGCNCRQETNGRFVKKNKGAWLGVKESMFRY